MQDYYDILGTPSTATLLEVKRAYRRLVRQHHPDITQTAENGYIKQLNEAYEVLRDEQRRAVYNAHLLDMYRRTVKELEQQFQQQSDTNQSVDGKKMTWTEGMHGFVSELKKEMKEE